ncbi:hypothetical protein BO86DRAFT_201878 [Aspergillus japonicus CBS 114.51]|uniref:Uncharacterized protein n=1 Tax=Aspergillus japonicus CBS 114.51 TaxID=1448312 RepID=A0A8T8WPZ8_ASPJA|nr:hypothetical protein BO86DRAFT_201878 [Aspergillus japonicus CBS 114.51]RAH77915.1 hypothetical protein BO86DRAFT_201878 [Aspergillus japonicus CBS 114.51]
MGRRLRLGLSDAKHNHNNHKNGEGATARWKNRRRKRKKQHQLTTGSFFWGRTDRQTDKTRQEQTHRTMLIKGIHSWSSLVSILPYGVSPYGWIFLWAAGGKREEKKQREKKRGL